MREWLFAAAPHTIKSRLLLFLIVMPPILAATVIHGVSVIYCAFFILALFNCKGGWDIIEKQEKQILVGFVVFFIFSALSILYSTDPKEGGAFLERYIRLVFIIPIYLMLRIHKIASDRIFVLGSVIGVFAMAIQAWYEVEVLHRTVAHGAYHKIIIGDLAILCSSLIFVAMLYYAKSAWHYALAIFSITAGGYASLLSHTRAAWLFIPIFIVLLIWMHRRKLTRRRLLGILSTIGIVISVLIAYPPQKLKLGFSSGISDVAQHVNHPEIESSWGARLNMWRHSVLIFKAMPVLGAGVGGYYAATQDMLATGVIPESMRHSFSTEQSNAHSIYFQLLAEGGIVGLLLMVISLLVLPSLYLYRLWLSSSDRDLCFISLAGLTGIIAFAWFGMSTGWLIRNPPITIYCFIIIVFLSSAANRKERLIAIRKSST